MSINKTRIVKLEQQHGVEKDNKCLIFTNNMLGAASEEEQFAAWQIRHPSVEPNIIRVELVPFQNHVKQEHAA